MMHNTAITHGTAQSDSRALAIDGAQPVWMTLNEARERAFTGEVVFEVDPEVHAYLDNGVVYYAERTTDGVLGGRLLDAGALDAAQLERGIVRVGDVEHLGRLFDRDPSVDRDAVLVMTETLTEDLVAELANQAITTVRVTAYRHHPSGVHRWFTAPAEPAAAPQPVDDVTPLESTVVDALPGLSAPADVPAADAVLIEWDEPLSGLDDEQLPDIDEFESSMLEAMLDRPLAPAELDDEPSVEPPRSDDDAGVVSCLPTGTASMVDAVDFPDSVDTDPVDTVTDADDAERATAQVDAGDAASAPVDDVDSEHSPLTVADDESAYRDTIDNADVPADLSEFDFQVVWPDGAVVPTHDVTTELPATVSADAATVPDIEGDPSVDVDAVHTVEADPSADVDAVHTVEGDPITGVAIEYDAAEEASGAPAASDEVHLEVPPLVIGDDAVDEAVDDEVPDDVADAVRRAIAAIESATTVAPSVAPIAEPDPVPAATLDPAPSGAESPSLGTDAAFDQAQIPTAAAEHDQVAATAFGGFAPPTMATRAEVMYGQVDLDDVAEVSVSTAANDVDTGAAVQTSDAALDGSGDTAQTPVAAPPSGVASVVFVDDEPTGGSGDEPNERSSALRRLIDSLRRKDR